MKIKVYKKICLGLIFSTICFVVSTGLVSAEDIIQIKNTVQTSSNTGGQISHDGQNGHDGAPGKSGANGQNGESGQSGADGSDGQSGLAGSSVITGKSTASIHIESSIDGNTTTNLYSTQVSDDETSSVIGVQTIGSVFNDPSVEFVTASSTINDDEPKQTLFQQTLLSIRLMILKYVNLIF